MFYVFTNSYCLAKQKEKKRKKLSMLLENPMSQEMGMMQKDGGGDDYEHVSNLVSKVSMLLN